MSSLRLVSLRALGAVTGAIGLRGVAAVAHAQVGELQVARQDYASAANAFRRARDLDRDPTMRALDLGNLGYCLFRLGRLKEAAAAYQEGLVIRYRQKFTDGMATDLYRYYHVCHHLGERAAALDAYGMYRTPPGSPITPRFEDYPVELDATGARI